MSWFARPLRKLRALFKRQQLDADMAEEMQHHIELQIEENLASGMSPAEARLTAQRQFGHVEGIKETCRDQRGWMWIHDIFQDLRYGIRQLKKAPGFAAITILTIALGIGASTAMFSIVNRMILHPFDYEEPEDIVLVRAIQLPEKTEVMISPGTYHEWLRQSSSFESLSVIQGAISELVQGDRVIRLFTPSVTANYFSVYRIKPILGRLFLPQEMQPGKDSVAIISDGLWQTRYGGREEVLGESIRLNERTYTIVGVIHDPHRKGKYVNTPNTFASEDKNFSDRRLLPQARLKPGVSLEQAQREMDLIAQRANLEHPESETKYGIKVTRATDSWVEHFDLKAQLFTLLGAVGLLLVIACVNVASLLLARANVRQQEIAMRAALGASRRRLIRQFLGESLLISIIGGLLGILIAYASMEPLVFLASKFMRNAELIAVDGQVLFTMCSVMLVSGLGFGLVPALQATRGDLIGSIKEGSHNVSGGRDRQRVRNALVILEISLALVLLVSSGLMVRSLRAMQTFDQGVRTENVFGSSISLNFENRYQTPESIVSFTDSALERIQARHDVKFAAFTVGLPMDLGQGGVQQRNFILEGGYEPTAPTEVQLSTDRYAVTPDYFKVMSIPLIRGRVFTAHDNTNSARVIVINREMVSRHFSDKDPIGQRIRLLDPGPEIWSEIIGVVGDVKPRGPQSPTDPQVYQVFNQEPYRLMTLEILAKGPAPGLATGVRDIISDLDKGIDLKTLYPFQATIAYSWTKQRFNMILFTLFSAIALILAAIGIYGVISYSVTQRTHEIGIRMALGARPNSVMRLILISGAKLIGLGVLIGTAGALASTRLISSLLFNVSPYDPVSFVVIILLLTAIALLACWIPARRATKVDPMIALRSE